MSGSGAWSAPGAVAADGSPAAGSAADRLAWDGVAAPGPVPAPKRSWEERMSPEEQRQINGVIGVGGLVVGTLLAAALAIIEAYYSPLRVFGVRMPVSLVLALVTNPLLGWFVTVTSGRRFAALLPAGAWCVIWVLAAGRTSEGDLVLTDDNWVGLATLFAGPIAFVVGIYVQMLKKGTASDFGKPRFLREPTPAGNTPAGNTPGGSAPGGEAGQS